MDSTSATTPSAAPASSSVKSEARRDAIFALRYGQRYGVRMARLYGRLTGILRITELVLGSAAAISYFSSHPNVSMAAGLLLAIVSAINIAADPAARAASAIVEAEKFGNAVAASTRQSDDELEATLLQLQATPRPEIESLREPVWRDVVTEMGMTAPVGNLTPGQKLVALIA